MNQENRYLGAREKVFWLLDQTAPVHLVMAAEMTGTVSVEQWRSALDCLQKRHPLLSVCIENNGYRRPRFRHVGSMPIPLRWVDHMDMEEEIAREVSMPFDSQNAPLMRAALLQKGKKTLLIFSLHHSIGDGTAGLFLIRDLLASVSGKRLDPLPMPPAIDVLLNLPEPDEKEKGPETPPDFNRDGQTTARAEVLKLSGEFTSKLLDRSRKEDASVHGALCTAFMKAYRRVVMEGNTKTAIKVISPYSIRQAIGGREDLCLYFGSKPFLFHQEENTSFWDLARFARNALKGADVQDVQKGYQTLQQWVFSDKLSTGRLSDLLQFNVARELMVSNLVRWPFETDFPSLKLESVLGPVNLPGHPGEYTVSAITSNGSLGLVSAARSPAASLLPATVDILQAALL